ncbi:hypothetical protein DSO57_1020132 [Entomophthora muscae]|uniref:Uncharacterized protein n=1 Tax=Entomophthora muscae TaxID=34485 RepID=A0ACC2TET3_9FUNG|nr:hypothetical protein DSO57_1020132 [Entomophthora muscae]
MTENLPTGESTDTCLPRLWRTPEGLNPLLCHPVLPLAALPTRSEEMASCSCPISWMTVIPSPGYRLTQERW